MTQNKLKLTKWDVTMAAKIDLTTPALTTELSPDGGLEFATFMKIINVFELKLTLVKS